MFIKDSTNDENCNVNKISKCHYLIQMDKIHPSLLVCIQHIQQAVVFQLMCLHFIKDHNSAVVKQIMGLSLVSLRILKTWNNIENIPVFNYPLSIDFASI